MSNTIRRKNAYIDPHQRSWLQDTVSRKSKYGGEYWVRVEYKGKAKKKAMAEYHSDHFPRCFIGNTNKWFRRNDHRKFRMVAQTAICNFIKDPDYEIILRAVPRVDYWD